MNNKSIKLTNEQATILRVLLREKRLKFAEGTEQHTELSKLIDLLSMSRLVVTITGEEAKV